ncbi:MAG: UDP-N-acetylmuramoyl-tripeptide--D-alanyl-D-alanine ligase [Patescibacteria group bacterium]|jgi:UDP-N-acetylmuramoyl-tripeptide--D-alanyl-D-alanine ligase
MKKALEIILYYLAKIILWRYKPQIIGVTGSVGKTSTKEAIYAVLKEKFKVRRNIKNYNNEIGVPLTIIGAKAGGRNIFLWLAVFFKALVVAIYWPYPKVIVLEMGADKPGDIKYLIKLAPCHIGIITAVGENPVHLEFFKNVEHLIREKANIITHLKSNDFAVINTDDASLKLLVEKTKASLYTIGQNEKALIRVSDINYTLDLERAMAEESAGISFKVNYQGHTVPFKIMNALGEPQVYAALCAIACGLILKMNLVEISAALKNYKPPKGRMNLLKGIKDTIIIDDSYNSSPLACEKALEVLSKVQVTGRKIACLGNMEELGDNSKKAHRELGRFIAESGVDILITVGDKALNMAEAAKEKNMTAGTVLSYTTSNEASRPVQDEIHRGDIILIKGSQSARMEIITKEIMANPELAEDLLVRQEKSWAKNN